jgi:hypothetical protein
MGSFGNFCFLIVAPAVSKRTNISDLKFGDFKVGGFLIADESGFTQMRNCGFQDVLFSIFALFLPPSGKGYNMGVKWRLSEDRRKRGTK